MLHLKKKHSNVITKNIHIKDTKNLLEHENIFILIFYSSNENFIKTNKYFCIYIRTYVRIIRKKNESSRKKIVKWFDLLVNTNKKLIDVKKMYTYDNFYIIEKKINSSDKKSY